MSGDYRTAEGQKRLMDESIDIEHLPRRRVHEEGGDHGADPLGDGTFRMVPSGDVVSFEERNRRLERFTR